MVSLKDLKESSKDLNILYVEDDEESREQLHQILSILFENVDIAYDGQDALEKYENMKYDLVITDINMPRMDGLELSRHIKESNPLQKVIIVSAHDSGEYLLAAIRIGVDDFILKPVEIEQLQSVLYKVTRSIHAEKALQNYHIKLEEEVSIKTAEIHRQAITDELTGFMNRYALSQRLQKGDNHSILLLNVDNFDSVNITYGYSIGDELLKKIASFLNEEIPKNATLYRVSADEFVFLYTEEMPHKDVEDFASQIKERASRELFVIDDIHIKFSFTMVLAQSSFDLLKKAHIALKETRDLGKNRFGIYTDNSPIELRQTKIQHYMMILRSAIEKSQIVPYYQAIYNNKTKKVEKFECLARLEHDGKIYNPIDFIEIAEVTGMLHSITKIIAQKAFQAFSDTDYSFSINISEKDLNLNYLVPFLPNLAHKHKIDPSRVVIEVLEGISADGAEQSLNQLMELKKYGFLLAIDDFGAQNSNFERVHKLEVDFIKIDGSFIKNIATDETSYKVSKTITDFSKSVGAKVIAEFVHNEDVYNKVLELGIEYSQGYYFSQPKAYIDNTIASQGIEND